MNAGAESNGCSSKICDAMQKLKENGHEYVNDTERYTVNQQPLAHYGKIWQWEKKETVLTNLDISVYKSSTAVPITFDDVCPATPTLSIRFKCKTVT